MRVDSQRAVFDLSQLSFWQRLKGAWFLLVKGRFQIDGMIHNDFEAKP